MYVTYDNSLRLLINNVKLAVSFVARLNKLCKFAPESGGNVVKKDRFPQCSGVFLI